jgi:hypothetical protein
VAVTVPDHLPGDGDWTALDVDNAIRLYYRTDVAGPVGLVWSHHLEDGRWCAANIPFRGYGDGRSEWTILIEDPLTLASALRCKSCRRAAWLEGGKLRAAK